MSIEQWESKQNAVLVKSFAFAVRMLKLNKHLRLTQQEYIISKQLIRCGTSIGANIEEAVGAISKADFSAKISIAYKEARETSYWLRLLYEAEYLDEKLFRSLHDDCQTLCRILFSILRTTGRA
ncbi:four helix bundle protein [Hymenobacter saemangeumensis]|uniref:Four helix bundle protein n=1 Tax=Hymenobacter saemangeumensis TaxID=1084522 RepID=A0ABP8HXG7_9BACT